MDLFETIQKLAAVPAVSGFEHAAGRRAALLLERYADTVQIDALGNVLGVRHAARPGGGCILLDAHIDEIGMIVTGYAGDFLRFETVGGVDPRMLPAREVRVLTDPPMRGVITCLPPHVQTAEEMERAIPKDKLYIDLGIQDAPARVPVGTPIVYDADCVRLQNDRISGRALDDRAGFAALLLTLELLRGRKLALDVVVMGSVQEEVGCAAMLSIIKQELPFDTWFTFTVQEEVGLRGATVAAQRLLPDRALILEGTTAADIPGMEGQRAVCLAGGGAVLGCMDRATIYDRAMFEALRALADANGIPWQIKRMIAGGTDAGIFHKTGAGARVASISVPVRYIHSPASVAAVSDLRALETLAHLFITSEEGAVCSC